MDKKELENLGADVLADIILGEIKIFDSKIKELQAKIKEYEGHDDMDSSYMQMAYGFQLSECESSKRRLIMVAEIERDRKEKHKSGVIGLW